MKRFFDCSGLCMLLFIEFVGRGLGDETPEKSVEQERLETMRTHAIHMEFRAREPEFPKSVVDQPLFRYDDQTRGYVDGAVWRLGATGRPMAIVTTELHPKYGNEPRIVCDYLSMTDTPFVAKVISGDTMEATWTPSASGVAMTPLSGAPKLAETKPQRLFQLKKMSERFQGHQTVEGEELELRLLPRPIDRYQPFDRGESDAAIFVFVSGRNPGVLLVLEATNDEWQYGVGRLSGPSALRLSLDGTIVWQVKPAVYAWNSPYTAANFPIVVPGF